MTVPWLWLYGPPGVGKSATGFELYEQLVGRGERVAFVELDQIGMCMPAPVAQRSAAKTDNLLGMLANVTAAGAHGVVVCGDIVETMSELLSRADERPLLCRLRADDDVTVARLTIRESVHYAMSSSAYESFDVPAGDLEVITHPLGVDDVAREILARIGAWPPRPGVTELSAPFSSHVIDDSSALLVTGPRAVGTSMVAWQVLMASVASGHRTGYLDVDQLGFLPGTSLATKLSNVAACWTGFRKQGAERLVLCGHLDGTEWSATRDLMPRLRVAALTAAPHTLLDRARRRSRQKDIWLPGDDLFGREETYLREVVGDAATFDPGSADLLIETDDLTPADIAACIAALWPDEAIRDGISS